LGMIRLEEQYCTVLRQLSVFACVTGVIQSQLTLEGLRI
jgi:hypothetical protein